MKIKHMKLLIFIMKRKKLILNLLYLFHFHLLMSLIKNLHLMLGLKIQMIK
jgi:hypothetical protein